MCTVNMQRDGAFCFSIDHKNLLTCDDGISSHIFLTWKYNGCSSRELKKFFSSFDCSREKDDMDVGIFPCNRPKKWK